MHSFGMFYNVWWIIYRGLVDLIKYNTLSPCHVLLCPKNGWYERFGYTKKYHNSWPFEKQNCQVFQHAAADIFVLLVTTHKQ